MEYQKTNREKRLTPKSDGKFWCHYCDGALVGNGERCPSCDRKNIVKTLKKETNA